MPYQSDTGVKSSKHPKIAPSPVKMPVIDVSAKSRLVTK
jgi:hypothetical protein